ncbi:uncharacterized protein LACBIDRAFT_335706 [Laccaria bicolor S238N-H82]|uniref:Predicted protein n=1 Tax=Laccaria bicolor (strain S238N-H82 / ATCC MYA-4686) TaxID=486041 RepID=B0E355_LACBS|nr:uncharacterized protein LACBIDRAFT_335706 [Laccaria bicolor S238N-H82]EDQ98725.1 predicted protein [Laccaria bicolor S238N-H82]|eukprot:XP_001890623.1 predicted protein [Laccaria bicolor S238N-H82]
MMMKGSCSPFGFVGQVAVSGLTILKPELFAKLQAGSGPAQAQAMAHGLKSKNMDKQTIQQQILHKYASVKCCTPLITAKFFSHRVRTIGNVKVEACHPETLHENGVNFANAVANVAWNKNKVVSFSFSFIKPSRHELLRGVPPIFEAMAQGFMHHEPELWALLGLVNGPRRPGFGTACPGWLTALGRARHITNDHMPSEFQQTCEQFFVTLKSHH